MKNKMNMLRTTEKIHESFNYENRDWSAEEFSYNLLNISPKNYRCAKLLGVSL